MADQKNKLEDFFKNRINDFDESNDGWDLPDESAWGNAQTHFPNHPQKKTWNWRLGVVILLAFFLLSAGTYIYFLKKDLTKKINELELAQIEIEKKNNLSADQAGTITSFENQIEATAKNLISEKNNTKNAISSLIQQEQNSIQTIFSQKKAIQILQNENQKLREEIISVPANFVAKSESNIPSNENSVSNLSTTNSKEILENVIPIAFADMGIKNDFPIQQLDLESEFKVIFPKPKKKSGKFEIGLSYSSMNFEIPLAYDFEKLEKEDFGKEDWSVPVICTGGEIHLAYKVRPNLWITTGLRRTNGGFENNFSDKLIYDKSGEYFDDEGKTINEFEINTQSGFGDAGSAINFEIPTGTNIENGDFVETEWNYAQQYKFTQIPIGVNYFVGKNKLKWFLKGGIGWNRISFGEYSVEAQLSYDNEILPIKNNEKKEFEVSSQFLNGFAGAGLNYQLTNNWNARTSFTLEKNFIQKNDFLNSNALSKVFEVGINYRF